MCRKARGTKQWQGEQGTCRKLIAKPTTQMPSFLQPSRQFSWDWSKEKKSRRLHWLAGGSSVHVMHVSLLGTKRGPGWSTGWQTPHQQPQRPCQGPCARGMPLPGNMENQRISAWNPPPQLCLKKKKFQKKTTKKTPHYQFGKIGFICILISEIQKGFSGLLCPALDKVVTAGGFFCHYSGWRNTYN